MDSDDKAPKDKDASFDDEMLDDESLDEVVSELESAPEQSDDTEDSVDIDSESSSDNMPEDALSRTPEDIKEELAEARPSSSDNKALDKPKKVSPVRKFFRKVNVYILLFVLLLVIVGSITVVFYLNATKPVIDPTIATQDLTEEELQQLANTDASVGNSTQTLTIRGSAVIDGQTLMRSNLNVAGSLQTSGALQSPSLTVSGASNLGTAQVNTLQVAGNTVLQGDLSVRDLSVAGSSSFSGNLTASQITVTNLILSGNALLEVPNHISFTGPTPSRTVIPQALGSGGSASVNGSDTTGTVNINTGNNPAAGCFVRINFNQAFTRQPHVIISPVGSAASRTQYYVERNQNNFSICTSAPAPANQAFAFDYFVTG